MQRFNKNGPVAFNARVFAINLVASNSAGDPIKAQRKCENLSPPKRLLVRELREFARTITAKIYEQNLLSLSPYPGDMWTLCKCIEATLHSTVCSSCFKRFWILRLNLTLNCNFRSRPHEKAPRSGLFLNNCDLQMSRVLLKFLSEWTFLSWHCMVNQRWPFLLNQLSHVQNFVTLCKFSKMGCYALKGPVGRYCMISDWQSVGAVGVLLWSEIYFLKLKEVVANLAPINILDALVRLGAEGLDDIDASWG